RCVQMRVLVTGVGGLIGSSVAAVAAQQSWDVLGCHREQAVELAGVQAAGFDVADRKACVTAAMEFEPDVIVHAAGVVSPSRFEREPYLAQVDYVGAEHTLAAARAVRARYVLVSCDWVHSGYRPAGTRFSERDLPDPVNADGSWPVGAQMRVQHVWEHSGLALRLVRRMRHRVALPAPAGVWRSPTYA